MSTGRVAPSITIVSNPNLLASRAVKFTQKSKAKPQINNLCIFKVLNNPSNPVGVTLSFSKKPE